MYYFSYLPIGTEVRLRRTPVATICLIGVNIACFGLIGLCGRNSFLFWYLAFVPAGFLPHTLITSLFLHAGFLHITLNLLYLWIFGSVLEDRLGWPRYLATYIVCGVLSNLVQAIAVVSFVPQNAGIPIVGASGAIAGLLGLFLIRFYYVRVKVASAAMLFLQGVFRASISRLNAAGAMLIWIMIQLAYGLATTSSPVSMTAYWSHVSGFSIGLALGLAGGMHKQAALEKKFLKARRYFEEGKWFASMGEVIEFLRSRPLDPDARTLLARAFLLTGQRRQAAAEYARAISVELEKGGESLAIELYEELKRVAPEFVLPASSQLVMARCLEKHARPDLAADAYLAFGRAYPQKEKAPAALLKSGEIYCAKLNDLEMAGEAYHRVRSLFPQTEWAQYARKKLAEIGRISGRRTLVQS
jgi:membrane associated rhomboid family serine protease